MSPRVFVFANQGHGTTGVRAALEAGAEIIGACSAPGRPWWRRVGARLRNYPFRDPFDACLHPSGFPGIRFFKSRDFDAIRRFLAENRPDMIISCSFHRLIPDDIFLMARVAFNVHAGLLPERGGGTPNRWAIRESDRQTGVTAHVLSKNFDQGDIVWQERVDIGPDDVWGDVEMRLTPLVSAAVKYLVSGGNGLRNPTRTRQSPNVQKSYRGEEYSGQPPDECRRICRATLPKFCGLKIVGCRNLGVDRRPCGLDIFK